MIHDGRSETPVVVLAIMVVLLVSWFMFWFVRGYVRRLKKLREDERAIKAAIEKIAAEKGFEVRWKEFRLKKFLKS